MGLFTWAASNYANGVALITAILTAGGLFGGLIKWLIDGKTFKSKELQNVNKELITEIANLKQQISELNIKLHTYENEKNIEAKLIQPKNGKYLYWTDKELEICPKCWYDDKKTIPINVLDDGYFQCPKCNNKDIYNEEQVKELKQNQHRIAIAVANLNRDVNRRTW